MVGVAPLRREMENPFGRRWSLCKALGMTLGVVTGGGVTYSEVIELQGAGEGGPEVEEPHPQYQQKSGWK